MIRIYLSIALILSLTSVQSQLNQSEIAEGLKDALQVGCKKAVESASKLDGFNGNKLIRIHFPPQAAKMESSLRQLGMDQQVDAFITSLNRAAEEASKEAAEVFIPAIRNIGFADAQSILKSHNHAATEYMRKETSDQLYERFKPIVEKALEKVDVNSYWQPLASAYNKVPFVEKVNPDLKDYTTKESINGLFKLMAVEEENIRTMGASRVTESLQKVFGQ